jgi:hypothetical protein
MTFLNGLSLGPEDFINCSMTLNSKRRS